MYKSSRRHISIPSDSISHTEMGVEVDVTGCLPCAMVCCRVTVVAVVTQRWERAYPSWTSCSSKSFSFWMSSARGLIMGLMKEYFALARNSALGRQHLGGLALSLPRNSLSLVLRPAYFKEMTVPTWTFLPFISLASREKNISNFNA